MLVQVDCLELLLAHQATPCPPERLRDKLGKLGKKLTRQLMEQVIEACADSQSGETPLMIATAQGRTSMVKALHLRRI